MLCPELWKFPVPTYKVERIVSSSWDTMKKMATLRKEFERHPMKRTVSVVIPANEPQCLLDLEADYSVDSCTLYRVREFPIKEMVRKEFVEAFVKRGSLYAVSSKASIAMEDCATITPAGELIMSLHRETKEKLQGNFDISARSHNGCKIVVKIDLQSAYAREQLKETMLAFDITLRWIPPTSDHGQFNTDPNCTVSSSSIAKYLRDIRQLTVEAVAARCTKAQRFEESIPLIEEHNHTTAKTGQTPFGSEELLDYIGLLALDCTTTPVEYVSSYTVDEPRQKTDTVSIFHRAGLITVEEIDRCIGRLAKLVDECRTIPWVGLHVQAFPNVPLDIAHLGGKGVDWNYDNAYTMVITSQNLLWSKCFGGNC